MYICKKTSREGEESRKVQKSLPDKTFISAQAYFNTMSLSYLHIYSFIFFLWGGPSFILFFYFSTILVIYYNRYIKRILFWIFFSPRTFCLILFNYLNNVLFVLFQALQNSSFGVIACWVAS